eukprot:6130047-Amphidinium_carterae.1
MDIAIASSLLNRIQTEICNLVFKAKQFYRCVHHAALRCSFHLLNFVRSSGLLQFKPSSVSNTVTIDPDGVPYQAPNPTSVKIPRRS